jgi:HupE / UreJ protein
VKLWLAVITTLVIAAAAHGHEIRPAYLEINEAAAGRYRVLWKRPILGEVALRLDLRLPESCHDQETPTRYATPRSLIERRFITCGEGGLAGQRVAIDGLEASITDVLVRTERLDGSSQVLRLVPAATSFIVEAAPGALEVARTYLLLGIEHILTGVDHLLFVSGLLLLVSGFGRLVKTISAFTLSHSVTLSLAALGFVNVPPAPVEAVIALSILFVACEIVKGPQAPSSLAQRKPWLVAFVFGLLHGLGFAGGLSDAGLPAGHIPLALGLFSAGVEIGHFSFVAVAVAVVATLRRWNFAPSAWVRRVPSYAIGSVAAFWVIQRIAAF